MLKKPTRFTFGGLSVTCDGIVAIGIFYVRILLLYSTIIIVGASAFHASRAERNKILFFNKMKPYRLIFNKMKFYRL